MKIVKQGNMLVPRSKGLPKIETFQLRPDCYKGATMALGTEYFPSIKNSKDK